MGLREVFLIPSRTSPAATLPNLFSLHANSFLTCQWEYILLGIKAKKPYRLTGSLGYFGEGGGGREEQGSILEPATQEITLSAACPSDSLCCNSKAVICPIGLAWNQPQSKRRVCFCCRVWLMDSCCNSLARTVSGGNQTSISAKDTNKIQPETMRQILCWCKSE